MQQPISKTIAFNDGALNATSRLHYWKGLRNPFREFIGGDKMTHCKFFSVKLHRAFQTLETKRYQVIASVIQ